jgi:hypothetical protein
MSVIYLSVPYCLRAIEHVRDVMLPDWIESGGEPDGKARHFASLVTSWPVLLARRIGDSFAAYVAVNIDASSHAPPGGV